MTMKMQDNTIYLLFNTKSKHLQLVHNFKNVVSDKLDDNVEFVNRDKFTITYNSEDETRLTDIKVLSKTKLMRRPKSANSLQTYSKVSRRRNIDGIIIRRATSFSSFEDLFLVRTCPLIQPLLSESELQKIQDDCKTKKEICLDRENEEENNGKYGVESNMTYAGKSLNGNGVKGYAENFVFESTLERCEDAKVPYSPSKDVEQGKAKEDTSKWFKAKEISNVNKLSSKYSSKHHATVNNLLKRSGLKERKTSPKTDYDNFEPFVKSSKATKMEDINLTKRTAKTTTPTKNVYKHTTNVDEKGKYGNKSPISRAIPRELTTHQFTNNDLNNTKLSKLSAKAHKVERAVKAGKKVPDDVSVFVPSSKSERKENENESENHRLLKRRKNVSTRNVLEKANKSNKDEFVTNHSEQSFEEEDNDRNNSKIKKTATKSKLSKLSEASTKSKKKGRETKSPEQSESVNNQSIKARTSDKRNKLKQSNKSRIRNSGIKLSGKGRLKSRERDLDEGSRNDSDAKLFRQNSSKFNSRVVKPFSENYLRKENKRSREDNGNRKASHNTGQSEASKYSRKSKDEEIVASRFLSKQQNKIIDEYDKSDSVDVAKDVKNVKTKELLSSRLTSPSHGQSKDAAKSPKANVTKPKSLSINESVASHSKVSFKTRATKVSRTKSRASSYEAENMLKYVLSDPVYLNIGWTVQAVDKVLSKVVTFKAVPANPASYCFRTRSEEERKYYSNGTLAVNMRKDGTGEILYPNGNPAVEIRNSSTGMRLVVFADQSNTIGREKVPSRVIGMFDSFGNGVLYNQEGEKSLVFNQLKGVYNDPHKKVQHKWKWNSFNVLEKRRVKAILHYLSEEKNKAKNDTKRNKNISSRQSNGKNISFDLENEIQENESFSRVLAELVPPVTEKPRSKKTPNSSSFNSVLAKANKEITLRINGQDKIVIKFFAEGLSYCMDLSVVVDPNEVERIDDLAPEKVNDVPCVFNDLLRPSPSLEQLQHVMLSKTSS